MNTDEFEKLKNARAHAHMLYDTAQLEFKQAAEEADAAQSLVARYSVALRNYEISLELYNNAVLNLGHKKTLFKLVAENRAKAASEYNEACDAETKALHELNSGRDSDTREFASVEEAEAFFTAAYDDGTFSISIVPSEDLDAQSEAYQRHWVCCGYGHEEITVNGVKYIAIYDYGH